MKAIEPDIIERLGTSNSDSLVYVDAPTTKEGYVMERTQPWLFHASETRDMRFQPLRRADQIVGMREGCCAMFHTFAIASPE